MIQTEIRHRAFVTRLPLGQALLKIRAYENDFKNRYTTVSAIEFELLQVTDIEDLRQEEIIAARVMVVEALSVPFD
jgi:hypothetical protein